MFRTIMSKLWSPSGNKTADELYSTGTRLIQTGCFADAEAPLEKSAAMGNVSAMHNLALLYKNGMASRFDLDEAVRLFGMASKAGHARAKAEHEILVRHQEYPQQASSELRVLAQNLNRQGGDGTFINALSEIALAALRSSDNWPDEAFAWIYNELEQVESLDQKLCEKLDAHLGIGPNESMHGLPLYDTFFAETARNLTKQLQATITTLAQDRHDERLLLFTRCSVIGRVIQRANLYPRVSLWGINHFIH